MNKENRKIFILFFILGFILYGNSLFNQYALDDAIVITKNKFTKKGIEGIPEILTTEFFTGFFGKEKKLVSGGRYRPLSVVTFAIEYNFFGLNPFVSHLINVLLYILTGYILFLTLSQFLPQIKKIKLPEKFTLSLPLLASCFWFAHPLHTEVVANIKGRDEILALLFSLLAFYLAIKYYKAEKLQYLALSFLSLFLGMMSKETAISFVFVIPFAIWLFIAETKIDKKNIIVFLSLLFSSIIYLAIRFSIIGLPTSDIPAELMNNPFLGTTLLQKYATIFYTFLIYFKLLVFPHPLTYDYYPYHIQITDFSSIWVLMSLLLNLIFLGYGIFKLKNNKVLSFSIIFYYSTFVLVSNLLFPVGVFMNERFMFVPSIGFAIVLAYFILKIKNEKVLLIVSLFIMLPYVAKTISRNSDWYDDFTLFTHDVKISYNSAKSNTSAGGVLIDKSKKEVNPATKKEMLKKAKFYLKRAITIHPRYVDALLLLGNAYYTDGKRLDSTWIYYKKILKINPTYHNVFNNLRMMFEYEGDTNNVNIKINIAKEIANMKNVPKKEKAFFLYKAGNFYGRFKNMLDSSVALLSLSLELDSTNTKIYKDLGVAHALSGNLKKAIYYTKKAIENNPNEPSLYYNLGVAYYQSAVEAEKRGLKDSVQYFIKLYQENFAIHRRIKEKKQEKENNLH